MIFNYFLSTSHVEKLTYYIISTSLKYWKWYFRHCSICWNVLFFNIQKQVWNVNYFKGLDFSPGYYDQDVFVTANEIYVAQFYPWWYLCAQQVRYNDVYRCLWIILFTSTWTLFLTANSDHMLDACLMYYTYKSSHLWNSGSLYDFSNIVPFTLSHLVGIVGVVVLGKLSTMHS